jgi:TPP-dependent indolepyruvate ferredoxin oxidoreductase alpha subunit
MEKYLEKMGYGDYSQVVGKSLQYLRSSNELEAIKGWAAVDKEKCTGCGKCEKPAHCNAVKIENKKSVIEPEKCLGCGICAALCPAKAISMHAAE